MQTTVVNVGKRKADEPGENGHYNTTGRGQVAFILQQRIQNKKKNKRTVEWKRVTNSMNKLTTCSKYCECQCHVAVPSKHYNWAYERIIIQFSAAQYWNQLNRIHLENSLNGLNRGKEKEDMHVYVNRAKAGFACTWQLGKVNKR